MSIEPFSISENKIKFHFQPFYQNNSKTFSIEKDVNGKKRKYLQGISSGTDYDAHNERVSKECIESFMKQANSGDILLYPDIHGIKQSEDVGILTKCEEIPRDDGITDWVTEYRLYDADDGIGIVKQEKINDIWKQINGMPPYSRPLQKGFSIEGIIDNEHGIIQDQMGRNILNSIALDGVCLVPRPAYQTSRAGAIYKAIGEVPPYWADKIKKDTRSKFESISNYLENQEIEKNYYVKKIDVESAFEDCITKIMKDRQSNKEQRLDIIFDEYKTIMKSLIIKSDKIFLKEVEIDNKELKLNELTEKLHKQYEELQVYKEKIKESK